MTELQADKLIDILCVIAAFLITGPLFIAWMLDGISSRLNQIMGAIGLISSELTTLRNRLKCRP